MFALSDRCTARKNPPFASCMMRREIAHRVVGDLAQRRIDDERIHRNEERIAVGRGLRDVVEADHARGAGLVVHDHRLRHALGELFREDARQHVHARPGGKRHDHADQFRADRVATAGGLRPGRAAGNRQQRQSGQGPLHPLNIYIIIVRSLMSSSDHQSPADASRPRHADGRTLLRRYWQPIAAPTSWSATPSRRCACWAKTWSSTATWAARYGLVGRRCPHRGADLADGIVEQRGLRCRYHGWLYDESGRCLAAAFRGDRRPQARDRKRPRIKPIRCEAQGGLVWAYLGPQTGAAASRLGALRLANGFAQVVLADVPCNWLQCQENSIDPVHFEWAHSNSTIGGKAGTGRTRPAPQARLRGVRVRLRLQAGA